MEPVHLIDCRQSCTRTTLPAGRIRPPLIQKLCECMSVCQAQGCSALRREHNQTFIPVWSGQPGARVRPAARRCILPDPDTQISQCEKDLNFFPTLLLYKVDPEPELFVFISASLLPAPSCLSPFLLSSRDGLPRTLAERLLRICAATCLPFTLRSCCTISET